MTHQESNDEKTQKSGDATRISLSTEFQHGEMVGGRYQVISRLGKGGMGLVYRVKQILLNKEFALKTIDKGCMSDMAVRRFQQEARTSFSLRHPNIIAVNDFGVLDDQTPFLVMELVNGETLGERLKTGCLTLEQAVPIFLQVCAGLEYAHECGIVHRDIKPNNIMLRKGLPPGAEGSIQILDFGIAKFTEREGGEIQALTRTGEIFGSPLYMSPEQCAGLAIDQRADVYSLGCVLFESLTGTPPFMGENALSTMMKHQTEPAVTLKQASLGSEFPQAIEDIVATMLAKSPDARYQNLDMVAHDLRALKRGESISHTTGSVQPVRREATISMGRNSFYALLVGVVVVATLIAWFSGYLRGSSLVQPPTKSSSGESVSGFAPLETKDVPADEQLKKQLARSSSTNRFALRNTKLSDTSFELIANASWINVLALNGCEFDNENLDKLSRLRLLKIDLGESTFNDIGAKRLSKCKELTHISANNTSKSDERMGENLSDDTDFPKIEFVDKNDENSQSPG